MSTALIQIFGIYSHNTVCTLLQVFFRHFHRKYCGMTVSAFFSFVKVIHRSTVRLKRIISYKICKASLIRFHLFISLWCNKTGKKCISLRIYKIRKLYNTFLSVFFLALIIICFCIITIFNNCAFCFLIYDGIHIFTLATPAYASHHNKQ